MHFPAEFPNIAANPQGSILFTIVIADIVKQALERTYLSLCIMVAGAAVNNYINMDTPCNM